MEATQHGAAATAAGPETGRHQTPTSWRAGELPRLADVGCGPSRDGSGDPILDPGWT